MSARVQNVRDFPQTKLDSVINARFLLNEHGDPHFLFYKFNGNNILNNWEKNWQKYMATFLANEIYATGRDETGPTEQVQIIFPHQAWEEVNLHLWTTFQLKNMRRLKTGTFLISELHVWQCAT